MNGNPDLHLLMNQHKVSKVIINFAENYSRENYVEFMHR